MHKVFNLILKTTRIIKTFLSHTEKAQHSSIKTQKSQQNALLLEKNVVTLLETTMSNQQNFEL